MFDARNLVRIYTMLQIIRNVVSGWVAVIIFVLLIIPFAFWGIDSYFGVSAINAAQVNDVDVSMAEYQRTFQNVRQQWQNISPSMAEQPEFIKQQTLDSLVNRLLFIGLKDDLGFRVNNSQVRTSINEIPSFRNPEGFDTVAYQNYLLTQGYTPARFEAEVRADMSLQQMQAGLSETVVVPRADAMKLAALQMQSRDFRYALISHDVHKQGIEIPEDEIQAYYQNNEQEFMSAEEVRLAYIHLSADAIAQAVNVDEADLRTYFDSSMQNYSIAERRKVKQIMVYTEQENKERAGEIAKEIHASVTSGTSFEDARNRYSDNTEVTVEVSDFGFINKGVLDTAVDEAVFSLAKGAISEPIITEFGHQIVTVEDITGGTSATFEDVRDQVELDYRKEQAQKQFFELYDELAVLTYEHPESLEVASESLDLPIIESGVVTRDSAGEALLNDPRILTVAFSDEVLLNGNNSDLIEIDPEQIVVVRVTQHNPPQKKALADVREAVIANLQSEKGTAKARAMGEEIKQKLVQWASMDALTSEYSIVWNQQVGIKRDNLELDREILQLAFKADKPAGTPVIEGGALANGDYAIVLVDAVNDVSPEALTEEVVQPVMNYLRQSMASRTMSLILEDLRKQADIEIYDINL